MEKVNRREVINRFVSKEINKVLERYNNLQEEEIEDIISFINQTGVSLSDFNPYEDYQTTKELARMFKQENNTEVLQLMVFLNNTFEKKVSIYEARQKLYELRDNGMDEEDEYYLFNGYNEKLMIDITEQSLLERLEDPYEVASMFDLEEIAEMWINRKSISDVVEEMMEDTSWWELLGCEEPEELFEDTEGRRIMICIKSDQ